MIRTHRRGPVHYVRELEALAKFSQDKYSEFFIKFLGWYESPDYLHIAMEYCPHGDLKKYLSQDGGKLPENQVKDIASQVLAGVVMMHGAGFANRDIKPANILINSKPPQDWWVKVCDFGLSKRIEGFHSIAMTVNGTPDFMPPELLRFTMKAPKGADYLIDMWCLGETVFQALTGQPVFGSPAAVGDYVRGSLGFPVHLLQRANASTAAISFIQSLMMAQPWQRTSAERAVKHPWMGDMGLEATVRVPDTTSPSLTSWNNGTPSELSLPSSRAPGDQLTQASGQWTTTMAFPNTPPAQQQQRGIGRGQAANFRPTAQFGPYYSPGILASRPMYEMAPLPYYQENPYYLQSYSSQSPRPNYPPGQPPYSAIPFGPTPRPYRSPLARPNSDTAITGPNPPLVISTTPIPKGSLKPPVSDPPITSSGPPLVVSSTPIVKRGPNPPLPVAIPDQSQQRTEQGSVEKDLVQRFKEFAAQRSSDRIRQGLLKPDKEIRLTELKQFAQSFKLATPVPSDLVPILANDPEKQREIRATALANAEDAARLKMGNVVSAEKTEAPEEIRESPAKATGTADRCESPTKAKAATEDGQGEWQVAKSRRKRGPKKGRKA